MVCTGDVESTQPTKMLMRLAEYIDNDGGREGEGEKREGEGEGRLREWFLKGKEEVLDRLAREVGRSRRERTHSTQWMMERWDILIRKRECVSAGEDVGYIAQMKGIASVKKCGIYIASVPGLPRYAFRRFYCER